MKTLLFTGEETAVLLHSISQDMPRLAAILRQIHHAAGLEMPDISGLGQWERDIILDRALQKISQQQAEW